MGTPNPEHLAYLESLRELQRRRGERSKAAREREQADDPEEQSEPDTAHSGPA
jgi:hypothetical protein